MNLTHWTGEPLNFDPHRAYEQPDDTHPFMKPAGLWISVDGGDDWPTWCRNEQFCLNDLKIGHRVTLKPHAAILHLRTPHDVDQFSAAYGVGDQSIDWRTVAKECDGIIIAPYQWSRRFAPLWYYGWDCASGCIWNLNAVHSLTRLESNQEPPD